MSERGEIEVLTPVQRWPFDRQEMVGVLKPAFREAGTLIAPLGRVLGLVKIARAETADGQLAVRATFAAEAPEGVWPHRKSFRTS